jgi:hypothetical protein
MVCAPNSRVSTNKLYYELCYAENALQYYQVHSSVEISNASPELGSVADIGL